VEIIRDDEGDDVGTCPNCGLNVGRVMTKNRYDKALAKLRHEEEEENKKTAKKKDKGGFWS
jgi:Zn-finger protein